MFDGKRISEHLDETELSAEDCYFLYRIMCQEQNIRNGILKSPGKKESEEDHIRFSQLSEKYQQRFKNIDWVSKAKELSKKGFVEIWTKEINPTEIKLTELKVTDSFKKYFLISDIDHAYTEVLEIWPPWVWVGNIKYPAIDKSPDEMAKLYNTHILKGNNAILHERFLMLTKMFLEQWQKKGAPYKLSKWIIDIFENVATALEQGEEPSISSEEI